MDQWDIADEAAYEAQEYRVRCAEQAAEIERLEEELKTARVIYDGSLELLLEQEAQLAVMRGSLDSVLETLDRNWTPETEAQTIKEMRRCIHAALATDGRAAADVMAAALAIDERKQATVMFWDQVRALYRAQKAYRKEG